MKSRRPWITDHLPSNLEEIPKPTVEVIRNGIIGQTPSMCVRTGEKWRVTQSWSDGQARKERQVRKEAV